MPGGRLCPDFTTEEGKKLLKEISEFSKPVLVLSGGTRKEDLLRFAYRPHMVVDSIADLLKNFPIAEHAAPPLISPPALDEDEEEEAAVAKLVH